MTPVKDKPLRAMVEKVVRTGEDVPSERPEGSLVEMTAGEDVPKLISAADDARAISELSMLKFAGKASGMPEVVKTEEAAVGESVEEITSMLLSISGGAERTSKLLVRDFVTLEDSSGPRPPDREMADAVVGTADVSASGLVGRLVINPGHAEDMIDSETGFEAADGRAPMAEKVPVKVDVQTEGPITTGVEPPRMETTAGLEAIPEAPVRIESGFSRSDLISS